MTPVDAIVRAVVEQGVAPSHHRNELRRLRREWPVLADALCGLVEQQRGATAVPPELRR